MATPSSRLAAAFPLTAAPETSIAARTRHRVRALAVAAMGEPWLTRFHSDEVDAVLEAAGWRVATANDAPLRFAGQLGVLVACEPAPLGAAQST